MTLKTARQNLFIRLFCALLAFHFFNLSIDPRDPDPDAIPEDLSFNDIESFTELIVEVTLKNENAFAEHEERDNHESGRIHYFNYYCANNSIEEINHSRDIPAESEFWVSNSATIQSLALKVNSPPPKV